MSDDEDEEMEAEEEEEPTPLAPPPPPPPERTPDDQRLLSRVTLRALVQQVLKTAEPVRASE
jgi:hypothetical protein